MLHTIVAPPIISHCAGTSAMEELQNTPPDANKMEALLNNRVTRAMLADNIGTSTVIPSTSVPDPPPPQMNDPMQKVRELDPDGILDKETPSDSHVKKDGEAVDPCHTLSSSESEEEDTTDETGKEMDVDQPIPPVSSASTVPAGSVNAAGTGFDSGILPDQPDRACQTAGTAATSDTVTTPMPTLSQPGSGPGSSAVEQCQKKDPGVFTSLNCVDPESKLGKAILQSKFKIPTIPKESALKVPTGVKVPGPKKIESPIPAAEADAVPSKTYNKIISSKALKGKVGTIGGITSGQGSSECGSFFNKGDNRVLRSVYKEDISTMSISSLSFNPVKWVCSSCPASHPVFGGGGSQQSCHSFGRPKLPCRIAFV
jgi:hypothetical protein